MENLIFSSNNIPFINYDSDIDNIKLNEYTKRHVLYVCGIECMYAETLGFMYADFGCTSHKIFGCMYAETLGCKVCECWVQVYGTVGCLPDFLCLPDSR